MLAKDEATRQAWSTDPKFAVELEVSRKWKAESEPVNRRYHESTEYYKSNIFPSEPLAYYHRAVPVKGFRFQTDHANLLQRLFESIFAP